MNKKIIGQMAFPFYRDLRPEDELIFHFAELLKKKAQNCISDNCKR